MMPKRKGGTPPPEPVYQAGKRKERCTKAINYVKLLMADSADENLRTALAALEAHKTKLNSI